MNATLDRSIELWKLNNANVPLGTSDYLVKTVTSDIIDHKVDFISNYVNPAVVMGIRMNAIQTQEYVWYVYNNLA